MEPILQFFEQYWGYTLFGSVTLGTLITFIVVTVKNLLANAKDKIIAKAKDSETAEKITKVCDIANTTLTSLSLKLEETNRKLIVTEEKRVEENKQFAMVEAVMFKSISYLIMASKLPTEDKLAIYESIAVLKKTTAEDVQKEVEVAAETIQKTIDTAVDMSKTFVTDANALVNNTVEETKSLLDKYSEA